MSKNAWLAIFLLIGITGCKATQPAATTPEMEDLETRQLVENASERLFDYEFLSAEANIMAKLSDKKQSFKADVRMQRDSVIWISAKAILGIEAARIMITPNDIQILDRINKKYIHLPFSAMESEYNITVSFSELQKLLVGNLLHLEDDSKISGMEADFYLLQSENNGLTAISLLQPEDFALSKITISEQDSDRLLNVTYGQYEKIGDQQFPATRNIQVEAEENVYVEMALKKIRVNETLSFPFNVNDSYEKVD